VSTALLTALKLQQPGYLPHCHAAATPDSRLTQGQILILGHRPQGLPSAPFGVPHQSIAFTERGQHRDR
jgi:hypothetical protein